MDYKVNGLSRAQIIQMAAHLRNILGYSEDVWFPVVHVLEKILPTLLPGFDYLYVTFDEMPDKHAETLPSENKIIIREDVYNGACRNSGRDRATIAHEIAHLLLHSDQKPSFARAYRDMELPAYASAEWQAKAFAAELLVPRSLCADMTHQEIVDRCGVSTESAIYQYNEMHKYERSGSYDFRK